MSPRLAEFASHIASGLSAASAVDRMGLDRGMASVMRRRLKAAQAKAATQEAKATQK